MDSETLQPIIDFIMQQGIWCALFIWFFITYKKEVSQREEKLYNLIATQGEKLEKISETLEVISDRVAALEQKDN